VGDEVNAALLDRLADQTRALSAYVRPTEDVEAKVSSLFGKIAYPVLTNLKLSTTGSVRLSDSYPAALPDLFHGGQLVVMGRFEGKGASAIKLSGKVGMETREFVFELSFPERTDDAREFVEHLWARRKVGFLLDQIRVNGEKKELVTEVTALAKRYGITTPYTSYLIVPDATTTVAKRPDVRLLRPGDAPAGRPVPFALMPPGPKTSAGGASSAPSSAPVPVLDFVRGSGDLGKKRGEVADFELKVVEKTEGGKGEETKALRDARAKRDTLDRARELVGKDKNAVHTGKLGVDLAGEVQKLRNGSRLERSAMSRVGSRNLMEVGGVWIDDGFTPKTEAVTVKAHSDAYFRILERHPSVKALFQLGNHLVWITPSGKALVIDTSTGKETLTNAEIDALFATRR
jgi:Ca-activated chloride channel family protein